MNNSHDEIKQLLKASRTLLSNDKLNEDINTIRKQYTLLTEDETTDKLDLSKSVEDKIDDIIKWYKNNIKLFQKINKI